MNDSINPEHYKRLPVEAIEIIESAIQGAPSVEAGYLHGQVLKYVLRCWAKNGFEDLQKAKWYLDRLIESLTSEAETQSDSIPDGWRELELSEIPSKGDKLWDWHECEWDELLHDGAVEYKYYAEKFIRKIEPPEPAFAIGDQVRVCKFGSLLDGCDATVQKVYEDGRCRILICDTSGIFHPSNLQPVESSE